jgi:putative transcriptional regulator
MMEVKQMKDLRLRNKVKISRIEKGNLSQKDLATKVGITRQTMNLIESEKYDNPSIRVCLLISKELGKPTDELFWLEDFKEEGEIEK